MARIGVGLIGTGFMGKAHALAWRGARAVMGGDSEIALAHLCEMPLAKAEKLAGDWGFARAGDDWLALVEDPAVDVVSITTPNGLHAPMAIAALEAGKHVWCEKPMALMLEEAEAMVAAAKASGKVTLVGYNYVRNPALHHAAKLIAEGRIGRVVHVRGFYDEDYQADGELPWTWRAKLSEAGLGALGDMGCHLVSMIMQLVGPIESVLAETQIIHETRPVEGGGRAPVENEDVATALIRLKGGARGMITTSRSAWGRKNRIDLEIHGTEGQITFEQERMNEMRIYVNEGEKAEQGFKTILTGPQHPPYAAFCPAPGHQLGFNDLKVLEAAELVETIEGRHRAWPDFGAAMEIERVIHAIAESAAKEARVSLV
ncbi:Gfo/Idh/MocA family oxidoreductase [Vannielia litorea]|uniref:Gfo/Idh/MocA family protein n=1 Tax=Vannielia litorea TaxID=1217970 RepID=UPI001C966BBC|nr:Gfo/Idh/MocA family oxidoreductase [Vannielia litorea]MBY6152261.1 Gfo/Idh/MocA family oxidoreductase [Vannielia litorea]